MTIEIAEKDAVATREGEPTLRRTIGLWQMVLYGSGSMLGSGIYGLIGQAAGAMGAAVWAAFLIALIGAGLTAFSYASLGSRYPRAGGAAYVTQRAYQHGLLTHGVGIAVACSGLTSIAAGARVIADNLARLPALEAWPLTLLAVLYLFGLAAIVYRGIRESMWVNVTASVIEAGGLLLVILVGMRFWGSQDLFEMPFSAADASTSLALALVVQGVVLTFFAFLGFEDALNVAEEVKNPSRTLPLGLLLALALTAILYVGVAITAVSVVPWRELAQAGAPLAEVMSRAAPWFPGWAFIALTIFAVANTGLINFITASRLLYGMARDKRLPKSLAKVHPERRTPHVAVMLILLVLLALVLSGNVAELAAATVLLLLLVFSVVNSALVILKLRPGEPKGSFEIPIVVPILGALVCITLFVLRVASGGAAGLRATMIAGTLLAGAALLYVAIRPHIGDARQAAD
jgi:basic amino acid/polyamine antiporter, APA family